MKAARGPRTGVVKLDVRVVVHKPFDNQPPGPAHSKYRSSGERDKKMDALANVEARAKSITEELLEQWSFAEVDDQTSALGELLIAYIDDDGLLGADLDTIIDQNRNIPVPG